MSLRWQSKYRKLAVIGCILIHVGSNPQGVPVAPSVDPFAPPPPPPNFGPPPSFGPPPPPPPNFGPPPPQNYAPPPKYGPPPNYGPPPPNFVPPPNYAPPPPNFGPPPANTANFGFGSFGPLPPQGPPPPPPRPVTNTADLGQPMPREAQTAASGYVSSHGTVEQEFEAHGQQNGAVDIHPPGATDLYYGPQDKTLLDAYYERNPGSGSPRSNDIFGGMFGGTPGGNLMGAYFIKEYVF